MKGEKQRKGRRGRRKDTAQAKLALIISSKVKIRSDNRLIQKKT